MNKILIDGEKCIGCGLCVKDCPNACLTLKDGKVWGGRERLHRMRPLLCHMPSGGGPHGRLRM